MGYHERSLLEHAATVDTSHLNYVFPNGVKGLKDISFALPAGARCLLVGANGAGKTTLLRLLAGKHLAPTGTISIAGTDPFKEGLEGVTYLGAEWVLNPVVRTDIDVSTLLASVGGNYFSERRDELISILDIDVSWHMHAVSDGERRRVQLAMGLLRPWRVLLLDEITVDLDILSRSNFLHFLQQETQRRACTILYATHIFDQMSNWPTHLLHMHLGTIKECGSVDAICRNQYAGARSDRLGDTILNWLREDFQERGPRDQKHHPRDLS